MREHFDADPGYIAPESERVHDLLEVEALKSNHKSSRAVHWSPVELL